MSSDYKEFEKWFKDQEISFYHGQYSYKQIAYSAYCKGQADAIKELEEIENYKEGI